MPRKHRYSLKNKKGSVTNKIVITLTPNIPKTHYGVNGALGGESIFYLSIIHHEIGHSRYGEGLAAQTQAWIPPDPSLRLTGDKNELLAVDRYENPVRLMYGYAPRTSYFGGGALQGCSIYLATGALCKP